MPAVHHRPAQPGETRPEPRQAEVYGPLTRNPLFGLGLSFDARYWAIFADRRSFEAGLAQPL